MMSGSGSVSSICMLTSPPVLSQAMSQPSFICKCGFGPPLRLAAVSVSKRNETLSSVSFPFRFSIFGNESLPFRFRFHLETKRKRNRIETETKRKRYFHISLHQSAHKSQQTHSRGVFKLIQLHELRATYYTIVRFVLAKVNTYFVLQNESSESRTCVRHSSQREIY